MRTEEDQDGGGAKSTDRPGAYTFPEMTLDELAAIYDSTVVMDRITKLTLVLACLNNYTEEGQVNIGFTGVSSSGKSYIALEVLDLFPPEDIEKMLYASPKSFFHKHGELVREDGITPLSAKKDYILRHLKEWEEQHPDPGKGKSGVKRWKEHRDAEKSRLKGDWDKIPKGVRVDLHQKILVFMDQPHYKLLETMRPVLSHDEKTTTARFADKDGSGALYAKQVGEDAYVHAGPRSVRRQDKTEYPPPG
jgi:hypothetical protein